MGRPERPLDPDAGPLQAFAADLRALRQAAGGMSYRQLARRAHYSVTTLAQAAGGEVMPTLPVTLAFVSACGGDRDEWARRWQAVQGDLAVAAAGPRGAPGSIATAAPATGLAQRGRRARWRELLVAWWAPRWPVAVAVALGLALGPAGWLLGDRHGSARSRAVARPSSPDSGATLRTAAGSLDGTDPKLTGCAADGSTIAVATVRTVRPLRAGGAALPAGMVLAQVELRWSARCGAAWGRLTPVPALKRRKATVAVEIQRPADGSSMEFRIGHADQIYGDMLGAAKGCVLARGWVSFTGGPALSAATPCRRA